MNTITTIDRETRRLLNPHCHVMLNAWIQGDFGISDSAIRDENGGRASELVAKECRTRNIVRESSYSYLPDPYTSLGVSFNESMTGATIRIGNDEEWIHEAVVELIVLDGQVNFQLSIPGASYRGAEDFRAGEKVMAFAVKVGEMLVRVANGTWTSQEDMDHAMKWLKDQPLG